ncbi:hypothetical protein [Tenacibaculum amylolyticum]|uniref:hypothetical protein n=1 Tax=Tenacibaculum amylolyticum TaxID=104269 RepID=UPI003895A4D6
MDFRIIYMFVIMLLGVLYLSYITRNKEQTALLKKGLNTKAFPSKKLILHIRISILNTMLVLLGIGIGLFLDLLLYDHFHIYQEIVYIALIFFITGSLLFANFWFLQKFYFFFKI